jgi:tetratricopeptide (TPR) repeat protein
VPGRASFLAAWLVASTAAAGPLETPTASTLARYSFEDDVDTGPDTIRVFQNSRGRVNLSDAFRVSGYRSVEIRDVPGDGAFPELQGYFPLRRQGIVYVHFAFLTAEPQEGWNAALAGPAWFTLKKDGIAFWLAAEGGRLVHHSDSIPRKLFSLQPFIWYVVDLAYDVAAGVYDLTVREEGHSEPRVALRRQPGAAAHKGSGVDKFSFIGDLGDHSRAVYYLDDVMVSTDALVTVPPLVAPGRRRLFVEMFREAEERALGRPGCVPVAALSDFGFDAEDLSYARQSNRTADLEQIQRRARDLASVPAGPDAAPFDRRLRAARIWALGCSLLEAGQAKAALAEFTRGAGLAPEAPLHSLGLALALARLGRAAEAAERLNTLEPALGDDPRFLLAWALVARALGDPASAEEALRGPAERALQSLATGGTWDEALPSQYHVVLLSSRQHDLAREQALRIARYLPAPARARWQERAGDAAFLLGAMEEARTLYQQALAADPKSAGPLLKLSDVAFAAGDLETERRLRERIYGRLRER